MEQRINYQEKGQGALKTLFSIGGYLKKSPLEHSLLELVYFRVSLINGCAFCLDMHAKDAISKGESAHRLYTLAAWRETPFFSGRERAGLEWAEAVTTCQVPDSVYKAVKAHFSDEELVDLTLAITTVNTWNRFNLSFPSPAAVGTYTAGQFA